MIARVYIDRTASFFFQTLRKSLDSASLQHVLVVSPDSPLASGVEWKICEDILKDPQLAAAVDIVGYVIE